MADAEVADKLFQRATGYSHLAVRMLMFQGVVIKEDCTEQYAPEHDSRDLLAENQAPRSVEAVVCDVLLINRL